MKFDKALEQTIAMAESAHKNIEGIDGVPTGLTDLDSRLGGLHKQDLVIIAGRPSMGKTALATNIAFHASKKIQTNKIPIQDLSRNKFQPRKNFNKENLEELTNSIKEQGVIQPIVVRPDKINENKYEIIAGERRWLASQNAGLHEVPVVILDIDDIKSLEFAIVENVQRQDLNPIEEARGYQKLVDDFNYNQDKLSKFIGKSRSYIANSLRLLGLPSEVLMMVESGDLSAGHARSLIGLNNSIAVAKKIVHKRNNIAEFKLLVIGSSGLP